MRRITTGQTGDPLLGKLQVDDNELSPLAAGDSLELSGNTVEVSVNFDVTGGNGVRIYEGSNYVDVNAPGLSSNVNFTLPSDTGTSGYVLRTDGSGNLSWVDVSFEVSNQTADTSTYYPLMSTSSSGSITGVTTTTGKLEFQPSSGTLTVDAVNSTFTGNITGDITSNGNSSFSSVDINGGSIDNTAIGSNTPAAGTFTSLTETSSLQYKTNVQPINNAIDKITKLNGVTYNRLDYESNNEAGLIAEEVHDILPNLVQYKNGTPDSISYTKLTAYLIECIKYLHRELQQIGKK